MCTLTWKPLDDGYALFFNRDELRSRPTAQPPDIHLRDTLAGNSARGSSG